MWLKNYAKKTLVCEKELSDINFERLKNALVNMKNNLIDFDDDKYFDCWFIDRYKQNNKLFK